MKELKKALRLNAFFSGISGSSLIIFNRQIAQLFGIGNTSVFWITGIILFIFTSAIVYEFFKRRLIGVLIISIQDFLWVFFSLVLLILQPFDISITGNLIILVIAIIVLFMGNQQIKALSKLDNSGIEGIKRLEFKRSIQAKKEEVWKVIADVANYDQFSPNIDSVNFIKGSGKGMIRSCSHGKDSWSETCVLWKEERVYSFNVDTLAKDYPYPFKNLKRTWEVSNEGEGYTRIVMYFDFKYKRIFHNWLLHPILKKKFVITAEKLLDNWQVKIEKKRFS